MLPAHAALYRALPAPAAALLASRLLERGLVSETVVRSTVGDDLQKIDGLTIASWCQDLSHAQVVLCLAQETSPVGLEAIEHLLRRPIYMCARGETGEVLTDISGRPLPLPLGCRRGEAPVTSTALPSSVSIRNSSHMRRDPRVIVRVEPNPKRLGTAAYMRYQAYAVGLTIEEVRTAGVTLTDVEHDTRRGFIELALPQDAPAILAGRAALSRATSGE